MSNPWVQVVTGHVLDTADHITLTLNGVTAGNLLVLACVYYRHDATGIVPSAPTDTQGTWLAAEAPNPDPTTGALGAGTWYQPTAAAGTHTVTFATVGGASDTFHAALYEFAASGQGALDAKGTTNATTAQTNTATTTGATTQATEIAVAAIGTAGSANPINITTPAGYTESYVANDASTNLGVELSAIALTTTGTKAAAWSWTDTGTVSSQSVIATFKVPAPGGSPTLTQIERGRTVNRGVNRGVR